MLFLRLGPAGNDEKNVKRDIITIVARTSLSVYFPYVIYNYFA